MKGYVGRTNVGPFWVYVGRMLGHLVGFIGFHFPWRPPRGENDRIIIILMMRSFLWVSVGPMLGNLGSKLGPRGSFGGLCDLCGFPFHGSLWGQRGNDRIIRLLMMRSFIWVSVGPMLGQCWAIWGLSWARVGCVGSFGGLCEVPWRSLE